MEPPPVDYQLRKLPPRFPQPRATVAGAALAIRCAEPYPDSILARLDKMDARLKRLEEKQQSLSRMAPPQECSYFATGMRPTTGMEMSITRRPRNQSIDASSLPLSEQVQLREMLMERLQFLESRILEVSHELDKSSGFSSSSTASSSSTTSTEETKWLLHPATQLKKRDLIPLPSYKPLVLHEGLTKSDDRKYQTQMLMTTKMKEPKDVLEAAEKMRNSMYREERKRMARTRLYKKWFPIGCG